MRLKIFAILFGIIHLSTPVAANHPGADLDKVMAEKERYFQKINKPAPPFVLLDAKGQPTTLQMFSDKVMGLHFIYANCPNVCPLHAEKLAEVQGMINRSPMKDLVQFISITTDPQNDTAEVLTSYGPEHGLDQSNWRFLTVQPGQDEAATRALAGSFSHKFVKGDDGLQVHNVVTHVIDKYGRWAANFHGLEFESLNLVLYINGLINSEHYSVTSHEKMNWWSKIKELLWLNARHGFNINAFMGEHYL